MQSAKQPLNEEQRITALQETGLLDTPREGIFDAITNATAALLDMPLSFVCFVDTERVWMKSSRGIDGVSEIQRKLGFCPHTITQKDIFEVKDASSDSRFHDNPFVLGQPHFLYYAGAPLITCDGHALGTLCVMDYRPRELSEKGKSQLKELAETTTALIEAKRREHIHQLSEEYELGPIVEIAPNEIYLVDTNTEKINYANRTAQLNIGCSLTKLKELSWNEVLIHSPEELISSYLKTKKSFFSAPISFQATQKRIDGSTYPVDCRIQASGNGDNNFLIISNDISQRIDAENREKSLQANIAHVNRINTASALSSGLAHELNQPLTAINQYCNTALQLLKDHQEVSPILQESLDKAAAQAVRAGEIVKRFRAFTEKRQPTRALINTNKLIDETILLLNHDLQSKDISLEKNISDALPAFFADPIQIQQVLLNLITNCIQATNDNNQSTISIECFTKEKNILFTISDNGPGIDGRLFDNLTTPSTSTKPHGTGLGLSICKFIIDAHEGKMWHDTKFSSGTRIHFTLPINPEENE